MRSGDVIRSGRLPASWRQTAAAVQQLSRSERRRRHAAGTGWLSVECDARARSAFRVAEDQESRARQEHLSHFQIRVVVDVEIHSFFIMYCIPYLCIPIDYVDDLKSI